MSASPSPNIPQDPVVRALAADVVSRSMRSTFASGKSLASSCSTLLRADSMQRDVGAPPHVGTGLCGARIEPAVVTAEVLLREVVGERDVAVVAHLDISAVRALHERREPPAVLQQDDPLPCAADGRRSFLAGGPKWSKAAKSLSFMRSSSRSEAFSAAYARFRSAVMSTMVIRLASAPCRSGRASRGARILAVHGVMVRFRARGGGAEKDHGVASVCRAQSPHRAHGSAARRRTACRTPRVLHRPRSAPDRSTGRRSPIAGR